MWILQDSLLKTLHKQGSDGEELDQPEDLQRDVEDYGNHERGQFHLLPLESLTVGTPCFPKEKVWVLLLRYELKAAPWQMWPWPLYRLLCILPFQRLQALCWEMVLALCPMTSLSDGWAFFSKELKKGLVASPLTDCSAFWRKVKQMVRMSCWL